MPAKLLPPDEARRQLARRYAAQHRSWLLGGGTWPWSLPLGAVDEQTASEHPVALRAWIEAWQQFEPASSVRWRDVQWRRLGRQPIPTHLDLRCAAEVAALIGETPRFATAVARYGMLADRWPALARSNAVARHFGSLADSDDRDFERLVTLLAWLEAHPASGHSLRQLPVHGIDTKWAEVRRALIGDLLRALCPCEPGADFYTVCGLRSPPTRLRMRVLCPSMRTEIAGLCDVEAPVCELASLRLAPRRLLLVENLDTGLALPDVDGCAAFVGLGDKVPLLAQLPWIRGARVLYWGDLDTHGMAILSRARACLGGDVQSVLMDEATLLAHRELWVEDPKPCVEHHPAHLNSEERAVCEGLHADRWGNRVRLEQERLPWDVALAAVHDAFAGGLAGPRSRT